MQRPCDICLSAVSKRRFVCSSEVLERSSAAVVALSFLLRAAPTPIAIRTIAVNRDPILSMPRQRGRLEDIAFRQSDHCDQGQPFDDPIGYQPADTAELPGGLGRIPIAALRVLAKRLEHLGAAGRLADESADRGIGAAAYPDDPVESHQRDHAIMADVEGVVELLEPQDVERGTDRATESAAGVRQPAAA